MKQRFYLYRRRGIYYLQDTRTGKQQSLDTRDRNTAARVLELKRQTAADPAYKQIMLTTCLASQDPLLGKRTWQTVMDQIQTHGKESSQVRYTRAMKSKAFNPLRNIKLVETTAEDFLAVLSGRKVSVVHYLKRVHNLALGLGWLSFPVLAPRLRRTQERGEDQRLRPVCATHEVTLRDHALRCTETAVERMELSFLGTLSGNQRSLVTEGPSIVLEIRVKVASDESR